MINKKIKLVIIGVLTVCVITGVGVGIKSFKKANENKKNKTQMIDENSNSFNEKNEEE